MNPMTEPCLRQDQVLPLLRVLPDWGDTVTIVFSGGCVFEFKGPFPPGDVGEGYYNLHGSTPGLHGHLRLDAIQRVRFQDRPHRGRASYAVVFVDEQDRTLFKVFLGRDADGRVRPSQLAEFHRIRTTLTV
jgi:putative heme utilization carrier protein HutX